MLRAFFSYKLSPTILTFLYPIYLGVEHGQFDLIHQHAALGYLFGGNSQDLPEVELIPHTISLQIHNLRLTDCEC
jgi:hypothetical protein